MMPEFQMACPGSIAETRRLLAEIEGEIAFLSGGTDLVLQMNDGRKQPDWVIDLSQIPELSYIRLEGERIRIGSSTTFAEIARSPLLGEQARCLAQAAGQVGSVQIRNRATLGGNIAGASPAGDSLPALLVLNAWLTILGPAGEREIPFTRFQSETGQGLSWGEFIAGISIPSGAWGQAYSEETEAEDGGQIFSGKFKLKAGGMSPSNIPRTSDFGPQTSIFSAFGKIGSRRTVTIAKLNMAIRLEVEAGESLIQKAGLALGALGRTPFRLGEIEKKIRGCRFDDSLINYIIQCLPEAVDLAIPGRYSQEYKRQAIRGLAADVLEDLARQAFRRVKEGQDHDRGNA